MSTKRMVVHLTSMDLPLPNIGRRFLSQILYVLRVTIDGSISCPDSISKEL